MTRVYIICDLCGYTDSRIPDWIGLRHSEMNRFRDATTCPGLIREVLNPDEKRFQEAAERLFGLR